MRRASWASSHLVRTKQDALILTPLLADMWQFSSRDIWLDNGGMKSFPTSRHSVTTSTITSKHQRPTFTPECGVGRQISCKVGRI